MNTQNSMILIDGDQIPVRPDQQHEYVLETKLVAQGYGVSPSTIKEHKRQHQDELFRDKHFLEVRNPDFQPGIGGSHTTIVWTKRGIIRLGFFIKSERAKRFRDAAEDLILNGTAPAPDAPCLPQSVAALAQTVMSKYTAVQLAEFLAIYEARTQRYAACPSAIPCAAGPSNPYAIIDAMVALDIEKGPSVAGLLTVREIYDRYFRRCYETETVPLDISQFGKILLFGMSSRHGATQSWTHNIRCYRGVRWRTRASAYPHRVLV